MEPDIWISVGMYTIARAVRVVMGDAKGTGLPGLVRRNVGYT